VIKMIAFGAITEIVPAVILMLLDGPVEEVPGFLDLVPDFWQIDEPERSAMFVNQMLQGNSMEGEVSVSKIKSFLGEIIGLLN